MWTFVKVGLFLCFFKELHLDEYKDKPVKDPDKLKLFYMWEGETIMVSKKFVIENEQGLHMRPAGVLAKAVTKFESDVTIVFEDKKINAKSLLNIIGACIKCGSEIELVCEGPDEEAALAHATELIESGLGG